MAATDAKAVPTKGVAYRVTVPIWDADGDLVTGATGLDSEVSIDGGAFADCTAEATEIGSSGIYFLDLTNAEMNGDTIAGIIKTSTVGAKTTPFVLYTAARNVNDLAWPTVTGRSTDVSAGGEVGIDWANIGSPTTTVALTGTTVDLVTDAVDDAAIATGAIASTAFAAGAINAAAIASDAITDAKVAADVTIASVTGAVGSVTGAVGSVTGAVGSIGAGGIATTSFAAGAINAAAIAADAIGASELAADAVTEIQAGLATAADLTTVSGFIDTEIADIQARLPAALVSGRIDASVGAMAANVITSAAIATGAIDADALAADAVDEIWAKAMTELTTVPGVTGTVLQALSHCFHRLSQKRTEDDTVETLYQADAVTVYATSAKSDVAGVFTSGKDTTA